MRFEPDNLDEFAFLFDVDGTLLDIAPTPHSVQVPTSLRRDLERLQRLVDGAVALVSGRPLNELDFMFRPLRFAAIGGHGAEIRPLVNGAAEQHDEARLPEWVRQKFADIAVANPNIIVEDKRYSVAIHFRLAPDKKRMIFDEVAAVCAAIAPNTMEVLHGKAVVEIKKRGFNKGTAVRTLMAHAPFSSRRPIFIGDDVTDEDAFSVMPEFDGLAISVGRRVKGVPFYFDAPRDVRQWVEHICRRYECRPDARARGARAPGE